MEEVKELLNIDRRYKSVKSFAKYLQEIRNEILLDVIHGKFEEWNEDIANSTLIEKATSYYAEFIFLYSRVNEKKLGHLDDLIESNQFLYEQHEMMKRLAINIGIDEMQIYSDMLKSDRFRTVMKKINSTSSKSFKKSTENTLESLIEINNDEELHDEFYIEATSDSIIVLCNISLIILSNTLLLHSYQEKRILKEKDPTIFIDVDSVIHRVIRLEPIFFKIKPTYNTDDFFAKVYYEFTKDCYNFINSELTSCETFVQIFRSKNLIEVVGGVYFNLDRYQISYILIKKMNRFFIGDYHEIIEESERFFKKPFGNSDPLPITKRDLNDYLRKFIGAVGKDQKTEIKNYNIIDKIFDGF